MGDEILRLKSDGTLAFGLKPVKFVHDPPVESWPIVDGQERLWPGDCVKRDETGLIHRVPMSQHTHVLASVAQGVAYVQLVRVSQEATDAPTKEPPA